MICAYVRVYYGLGMACFHISRMSENLRVYVCVCVWCVCIFIHINYNLLRVINEEGILCRVSPLLTVVLQGNNNNLHLKNEAKRE